MCIGFFTADRLALEPDMNAKKKAQLKGQIGVV